ncbi:hypothetical protein B7486_66990, partial [cyanobacterium TDX16]
MLVLLASVLAWSAAPSGAYDPGSAPLDGPVPAWETDEIEQIATGTIADVFGTGQDVVWTSYVNHDYDCDEAGGYDAPGAT